MNIFDIAAARVNEAGELCLRVNNLPAARQFVLSAKDKKYVCEIKQKKNRRSLDANAYFWVLCDKLAQATQIPKTEIYRNSIKEIGGVSETYCGKEDSVNRLCEAWQKNGLGWQAETMPSKLDGCINAVLYYGSSTYNTKQMSQLIDSIIQDCKAVGIETATPDEIARMLEEWHG